MYSLYGTYHWTGLQYTIKGTRRRVPQFFVRSAPHWTRTRNMLWICMVWNSRGIQIKKRQKSPSPPLLSNSDTDMRNHQTVTSPTLKGATQGIIKSSLEYSSNKAYCHVPLINSLNVNWWNVTKALKLCHPAREYMSLYFQFLCSKILGRKSRNHFENMCIHLHRLERLGKKISPFKIRERSFKK
jgi:hypothetical protein